MILIYNVFVAWRVQSVFCALIQDHNSMKKDIHPKYYADAQIKCSCGKIYKIGSTREYIETETCAACHPFYTGKARLVNAMGRVDKFLKRAAKKEALAKKTK